MAKANEKSKNVMRKCNRCNEVKPLKDFKKDRRNKSGYDCICKKCHNKRNVLYYQQESERLVRRRFHILNYRSRQHGGGEYLKYGDFLGVIANDEPEESYCSYCGRSEKDELKEFDCRLALDHIMPLSQGGLHSLHNVTLACKRCNSSKGSDKHVLEFFLDSEEFTEERLNSLIEHMAKGNNCSVEDMETLLYTSYKGGIEAFKLDHSEATRELALTKARDVLPPQIKEVI